MSTRSALIALLILAGCIARSGEPTDTSAPQAAPEASAPEPETEEAEETQDPEEPEESDASEPVLPDAEPAPDPAAIQCRQPGESCPPACCEGHCTIKGTCCVAGGYGCQSNHDCCSGDCGTIVGMRVCVATP